jgi:HEAT repeat protein
VKWKLWTSAMLATVAGTWALSPIPAAAQQAPPSTPSATEPASQSVPYDPIAILNGTATEITQQQRDEAAERILSQHADTGRRSLRDALIAPNEDGQLAVAHALGQDANPDPIFIDPLFSLLESQSAKIAAAAGRALAGYKADPEVLTRLIDRATARRSATEPTRLSAIRAIGSIPEKRGAAALYQLLISPDESTSIHKTAAEALINLTGLDQNGEDPARWTQWWMAQRSKPDVQFRTEIDALQDARLDRLDARYRGLVSEVETLLRAEYFKTPPSQRQELMLTFLQSPQAEVRKIGTHLISADVLSGNQPSQIELQRLRDMIADSDPGVRHDVADAISEINDPGALDALLKQLDVEPDPTVRAEIATALGPIHDLHAVPTLIKLLSDDSLQTAGAAAGALKDLALGPLPGDPTLARKTAQALKDTVLARSRSSGTGDLRAACIEALAPLQQSDIVHELIDHHLLNSNREESAAVRQAMLVAIGELNDPKLAGPVLDELEDESPDVQKQAIETLGKNPDAYRYDENVGTLLKPDPRHTQAVRDEAWKFMQGIFPRLSEQQLSQWAQELKDDPSKQLLAWEALADKQVANNEQDDLAVTRTQIGHDLVVLKRYGDAAASYGAALKIYTDRTPRPNQQATLDELVRSYEHALLDGNKYPEAITLAANTITRDPSEEGTMATAIADKVEELIQSGRHEDLAGAQQLIELAKTMSPKLNQKYLDRLEADAEDIRKKSSLDGGGPMPQSATVDGK